MLFSWHVADRIVLVAPHLVVFCVAGLPLVATEAYIDVVVT